MTALPVIAIFDIGKTNKKLFLLDQKYNIVFEKSARFTEVADEDGDSCEDLERLRLFIFDSLHEVIRRKEFKIEAINFSAYGASFVYLDEKRNVIAPLYNYLKEYPEALKKQFYNTYGGEELLANCTASPVLGNLNSGMQLYRIKYQKPELFAAINTALHLPQYLGFLISGMLCSDITSIGCHTNLWDFSKNEYHCWVKQEGILQKLPPILPCDKAFPAVFANHRLAAGVGLHDSSAALIPYIINFNEPFILISTGTWCISLNPFNNAPLTAEELKNDCLCYMTYEGKPIKASRLFAGYEHEQQTEKIAKYFHKSTADFSDMKYDPEIINLLLQSDNALKESPDSNILLRNSVFSTRELTAFKDDRQAYHQLIFDIVTQQYASTQLVLKETGVKKIFVDGGFSKNEIYMNVLATFFSGMQIFAASMAQATAVGAALCIHNSWNKNPLPRDVIRLKDFSRRK